ncbi:glycosyltransferase family 4 protein [Roseivirga sp. BDSF3-8]|uniref:glycosyltransferase family 4 protein n=1 Tax=Roseivirga sp. BDSF3-8 TaxID=3241598 RepID=UPI00353209B7
MPKLIRITTVPISLKLLITGQMKYMARQGYDVYMVSAKGPEIPEVTAREGVPHKVIGMTRRITPLADLLSLFRMILYMRDIKPDIVHTHTPKAGLLGMLAAWACGVPVRVHTVAGLPLQTARGMKFRLLTLIERITYACATEVWPNSGGLYSYIEQGNLTCSSKLHMIGRGSSNGIDLSVYSREALDSGTLRNIKRAISYDAEKRYLLTVGRMVKDKGIVELVEAFDEVAATRPDLHLVLTGPFEEEGNALPEAVREYILHHPRITHIAWTDDIPYYMAIAHLLVHPSHREGFPNVLLQAGAMDCPIVCSDISGNNDIVQNGRTGLLFEAGKKDAIAENLSWALDRPEQMNSFALTLKSEIITHFRRENIHGEIAGHYQRLLEKVKN